MRARRISTRSSRRIALAPLVALSVAALGACGDSSRGEVMSLLSFGRPREAPAAWGPAPALPVAPGPAFPAPPGLMTPGTAPEPVGVVSTGFGGLQGTQFPSQGPENDATAGRGEDPSALPSASAGPNQFGQQVGTREVAAPNFADLEGRWVLRTTDSDSAGVTTTTCTLTIRQRGGTELCNAEVRLAADQFPLPCNGANVYVRVTESQYEITTFDGQFVLSPSSSRTVRYTGCLPQPIATRPLMRGTIESDVLVVQTSHASTGAAIGEARYEREYVPPPPPRARPR